MAIPVSLETETTPLVIPALPALALATRRVLHTHLSVRAIHTQTHSVVPPELWACFPLYPMLKHWAFLNCPFRETGRSDNPFRVPNHVWNDFKTLFYH